MSDFIKIHVTREQLVECDACQEGLEAFDETFLSGADLRGADLGRADLSGADLTGVIGLPEVVQ